MNKAPFKLTRVSGTPVTEEEILSDLKRVAQLVGSPEVSQPLYKKHGLYDARNISRRFGSWNDAVLAAGLRIANEINIPDEKLFENLLNLWQALGRQPRRRDLTNPASTISQSPYMRRFSSWTKALECFVAYANASEVDRLLNTETAITLASGRDPSLRLRYKVLKRDSFKCQQCGISPATTHGVELHVDHIIPWSKGGLTTLDNLRTLCSKCNLGKGNCT